MISSWKLVTRSVCRSKGPVKEILLLDSDFSYSLYNTHLKVKTNAWRYTLHRTTETHFTNLLTCPIIPILIPPISSLYNNKAVPHNIEINSMPIIAMRLHIYNCPRIFKSLKLPLFRKMPAVFPLNLYLLQGKLCKGEFSSPENIHCAKLDMYNIKIKPVLDHT